MIYNSMDSQLIKIYKIKNLESIKFYDLTLNDNDKRIIVPALFVIFDNGKMINLSIKDKYFNALVKKVIEVYQEEKDHIIDDSPFGLKGITIDEHSRRILENCDLLNKNNLLAFYDNKDGYEHSLLFESDEIKSIIDVVRYEIMSFGEFANLKIRLTDNIKGYRSNYVIEGSINDLFVYLLIHYDKIGDNTYQISTGNLGGVNKPFEINITFYDDHINIFNSYQDILFYETYKVNKQKGSFTKRIIKGDKVLKYETGNLAKVEPKEKNIINLDYDVKDIIWYELPWSSYYGINNSEMRMEDNTSICDNHVVYLDINASDFYKREFYTKKVQRDSTVSKKGIMLTLDELRKTTFGYRQNTYYVIETAFKNARGNGLYQENFNGKYYYHLVRTQKMDEITRENLISARKDIISDSIDLLEEENIKKIGGTNGNTK